MVHWHRRVLDRRVLMILAIGLTTSMTELTSHAESNFSGDPNWHRQSPVQFDLPPLAPAIRCETNPQHVTVELRLSSMMAATDTPNIDQWLVWCQPRDRSLWVVDYAPRTETASDLATSIQVKNTSEESRAMGVGLDGAYGHLAHVNASADQGRKQIHSVQFDRLAPVHAVTASGTINRGRGVYFKLRWTAQQILEGEKTFQITLEVPPQWRGTLIDVCVTAQGERKGFAWEKETATLGAANFVVAVYLDQDHEAEIQARALAESEHTLRNLAARHRPNEPDLRSLSSVLKHVTHRMDPDYDPGRREDWLRRLLTGQADPHLDKDIRRLAMPVRVAVLEYAKRRDEFLAMGSADSMDALEPIADSNEANAGQR